MNHRANSAFSNKSSSLTSSGSTAQPREICLRLTFYQVPRTHPQRQWPSTRPQQSRSSCQSSSPGKSRTTRKFPRVRTLLQPSCTQTQLTRRSTNRIAQEESPIRMVYKTPIGLRQNQEGIIKPPSSHIVKQTLRFLPRSRPIRIWIGSSVVTKDFSLPRELQYQPRNQT